jgi:hypothetical protein
VCFSLSSSVMISDPIMVCDEPSAKRTKRETGTFQVIGRRFAVWCCLSFLFKANEF